MNQSRPPGETGHQSLVSAEPSAETARTPRHPTPRWVVIVVSVLLSIPLIALCATIIYIVRYEQRVYPHVSIGERSVGGQSIAELTRTLTDYNQYVADTGFSITLKTASGTQPFRLSFPDTSTAATVNVKATIDRLLSIGRAPDAWLSRLIEPWRLLFVGETTTTVYAVSEDEIIHRIKPLVAPFETEPHNAELRVSSTVPLVYSINPEQSGTLVQYQELLTGISARLAVLSRAMIPARLVAVSPEISADQAEQVARQIPQIVGQGALTLMYPDITRPRGGDFTWVITEEQIADWLTIDKNDLGESQAVLKTEPLRQYLEAIVRPDIDQSALDAVFTVENNRVTQFQPNQNGLMLDATTTIERVQETMGERTRGFVTTTVVVVAVNQVVATKTVADVNTLGISHIVGVGSSTFKDSHTNRIKNIANAVKRLNGVLIAPGEEFSTNHYAGPYITGNGFLPEMVIKGNEIKPEVGGGMCQIGTTLFRMAMNSGLPITERQNHSLVVSYYADPVNNNPGTDATLYEPLLDFKFVNDTGNYMLLTTEIDYKRQLLNFALWGKPDGRSGSYTHPIVKKWINAGPTQEIVSATAAPGSRNCQNAFRGAEATFTYTRFTPTGEKIERVFDSYYRPLPRICIVGPAIATPTFGAPAVAALNANDPIIDTVPPTP